MSFLNPYSCPKCGAQFPLLFIQPSMRIRRGFLSPYLKCANCGQISRQKINYFRAIWIWPLSISAFAEITHILQSYLYFGSPILYILIVWILLVPFFIALRHGFTLIPIEEKQKEQGRINKWLIPVSVIAIFMLLFGYYTQDWLNVIVGIIIGFGVWAIFYYFSKENNGFRS